MLALLFSRLGAYALVAALVGGALWYVSHLRAGIAERDASIAAHRAAIISAQRNAHAYSQALRSTQAALLARDRALAAVQSRRNASAQTLRRTAGREDMREVARLVVPAPLADILRDDDRAGSGRGAEAVPARGAARPARAAADNP